MASPPYTRGDVVKGPDLFGPNPYRPWVCLSNDTHPFDQNEGIYVPASTTQRAVAIKVETSDFKTGGLAKTSYINVWNVTSIKHNDIKHLEGVLKDDVVDEIRKETAAYIVPEEFQNRP
jgi:mRNA-degrading endonuclease toxin of MazEF toxin-antitoxin module